MQSPKHGKPPSSASAGFFQPRPVLRNPFLDDPVLQRVFSSTPCYIAPRQNCSKANKPPAYLPKDLQAALAPDLKRFGALMLDPRVLAHCADAERNLPYVSNPNPHIKKKKSTKQPTDT